MSHEYEFKAIGPEAKLSLIIICRQMWLEWKISESKNIIDISQQDHSQGINAGFWAPKSNIWMIQCGIDTIQLN